MENTDQLDIGVFSSVYYRPQTKFVKVMFYRCLSVQGGGHVWREGGMCGRRVCMAGGVHGSWGMQGGRWVYMCGREGVCGRGGMRGMGGACMPHTLPPDTMRYGDKVNERTVRILLECLLVTLYIYVKLCFSL